MKCLSNRSELTPALPLCSALPAPRPSRHCLALGPNARSSHPSVKHSDASPTVQSATSAEGLHTIGYPIYRVLVHSSAHSSSSNTSFRNPLSGTAKHAKAAAPGWAVSQRNGRGGGALPPIAVRTALSDVH